MNNQLKGIALLLLGIVFGLAAISLNFAELALIGGVMSIAGLVVVFLNG